MNRQRSEKPLRLKLFWETWGEVRSPSRLCGLHKRGWEDVVNYRAGDEEPQLRGGVRNIEREVVRGCSMETTDTRVGGGQECREAK